MKCVERKLNSNSDLNCVSVVRKTLFCCHTFTLSVTQSRKLKLNKVISKIEEKERKRNNSVYCHKRKNKDSFLLKATLDDWTRNEKEKFRKVNIIQVNSILQSPITAGSTAMQGVLVGFLCFLLSIFFPRMYSFPLFFFPSIQSKISKKKQHYNINLNQLFICFYSSSPNKR
jgi:hypothetical protein